MLTSVTLLATVISACFPFYVLSFFGYYPMYSASRSFDCSLIGCMPLAPAHK